MKSMLRFIFLFIFTFLSSSLSAQWQKINDVDYIWGPFKIYNLALFSETGQYHVEQRPLMLSLTYAKPVDGRDFAISLARSWSNLGITLPNQEDVVDRLRKIMPNIRSNDVLSYIALEDKGYFILNDTIIPEEFNQDFNNAVVAVWLDPRVEIGRKLLNLETTAHQAYKSGTSPSEQAGDKAEKMQNVPLVEGKGEEKENAPKQEEDNVEEEVLPPYDAPIDELKRIAA